MSKVFSDISKLLVLFIILHSVNAYAVLTDKEREVLEVLLNHIRNFEKSGFSDDKEIKKIKENIVLIVRYMKTDEAFDIISLVSRNLSYTKHAELLSIGSLIEERLNLGYTPNAPYDASHYLSENRIASSRQNHSELYTCLVCDKQERFSKIIHCARCKNNICLVCYKKNDKNCCFCEPVTMSEIQSKPVLKTCDNCRQRYPAAFFLDTPCQHTLCFECNEYNECKKCRSTEIKENIGVAAAACGDLVTCPECKLQFVFEGSCQVKCPKCRSTFCPSCNTCHDNQSCNDYFHGLEGDKRIEAIIKRFAKNKGQDLPGEEVECGICFESFNAGSVIDINCEHTFCAPCFDQYLKNPNGIEQIFNGICCSCPKPECDKKITACILDKLMDPKLFTQKGVEEFAEKFGFVYCPAGCGQAYELTDQVKAYYKNRAFYCANCKKKSCIVCNTAKFHDRWTCEEYQLSQSQGGAQTLLEKVTKQCPRCKRRIQKTSGCNRIHCECGIYFCYLCGGRSRDYGRMNGRIATAGECGCNLYGK